MRPSFVRLVVSSVLGCWAIVFVTLVLYLISQSWDRDAARRDGVFLVHELLADEPASERPARLAQLQRHLDVGLALSSREEVTALLGRRLGRDEQAHFETRPSEAWWILGFHDTDTALVAGPVDPGRAPAGYVPVGLILAVVGLPLLAATLTLRVEQQVSRVERASEALATGELGARVQTEGGPGHELSERFNAMAERVERLIRSRDDLVQAVSHELGSPLSRLRFHLELLDGAPEASRAERLGAMTRELDALDELVAELLTYVQSDVAAFDPQPFDPALGVSDLAELARLELPEDSDVDVEVVVEAGVRVQADPRLFLRAVENLLRNAVQHGRRRVRLEITRSRDEVWVIVDDDGPGIPEDLRARVTQPFVRLHTDRGRDTGGVGLGLAIVSRILQRHEGRLEVGAAPLGGARISTAWPAAENG